MKVRREIGDITEPYLFPSDSVQDAIEEAEDYLTRQRLDLESPMGKKTHTLQAALILLTQASNNLRNRPVSSISENGSSVSFESLNHQIDSLANQIQKYLFLMQDQIYVVE